MNILIIGTEVKMKGYSQKKYSVTVTGADPKSNDGITQCSCAGALLDLMNRLVVGYEKDDIL